MDPISTASAGLIGAYKRYDAASQAVVQATAAGSQASPAAAIVDQLSAGAAVKASAKVLQASDEMFQSTLDIMV